MDGPKYKLLFCEFAQLYPKRSHNSDYFTGIILQTIYVLNKEILQKKSAVNNQELFQIKTGL